jgi:hypothetical protein
VPLQRKSCRVPTALVTLAFVWQEENAGLVKLVVDSQTKRNVQRLTQTYLTLSLPDIAAAVGLPSAQAAELAILRWAAPPSVAGRASAVRTLLAMATQNHATGKTVVMLHLEPEQRCDETHQSIKEGSTVLSCHVAGWSMRAKCLLKLTTKRAW